MGWETLFIPHVLLLTAFSGVVLFAMVSDIRGMTIPNEVSIALLFLFVPVAGISGIGLEDLALHFAAGFVMFAIGAALFALNMFGGGDVKMLAAVAVWVGFDNLLALLLLVTLIGGVLSIAILGIKRSSITASFGALPWLHGPAAEQNKIPYGIAIGLGALFLLPRLPVFV